MANAVDLARNALGKFGDRIEGVIPEGSRLAGRHQQTEFDILQNLIAAEGANFGAREHAAENRAERGVFHFFEEDLQQHFREEEQTIFPKLPADNELRLQAEKEHALIYDLVSRLRTDKTNKELLQQLGETLKEHIRFEERVLFTYMQQTLPAAVLDEMASHDEKQNRDADAAWQDVFWVVDKSSL